MGWGVFSEMNKAEAYPWIGAVTGGLTAWITSIFFQSVAIILNILIFGVLTGAFVGVFVGRYVNRIKSTDKWLLPNIVAGMFSGTLIAILVFLDPSIENPSSVGDTVGDIIVAFFFFLLPAIIGLIRGAPCRGVVSTFLFSFFAAAILIDPIFYIISGKPPNITDFPIFTTPIFIAIAFALAGYGIGKRKGEIIAKKEELEQKINDYKRKIEQWEREGYDVSEWRERWFK